MPPLILLAVAGAGLYVGYKWVSRQAREATDAALRAQDALKKSARDARSSVRDLGELEWDEAAGVYKPIEPKR
jgi:predicted negative regulator of RcsB-dependent stress response